MKINGVGTAGKKEAVRCRKEAEARLQGGFLEWFKNEQTNKDRKVRNKN